MFKKQIKNGTVRDCILNYLAKGEAKGKKIILDLN